MSEGAKNVHKDGAQRIFVGHIQSELMPSLRETIHVMEGRRP